MRMIIFALLLAISYAQTERRMMSGLNTISAADVQPDSRDRVHTIWMNGPTYPGKSGGGVWPNWGTGSTVSNAKCDPTSDTFTGYTGDRAPGYCVPGSADFASDPQHLLIHSGRLGVVLDAEVASGPIAKLGPVSQADSDDSNAVYASLTDATLDITLDVSKTFVSGADSNTPQCSSDNGVAGSKPCPDPNFPVCRGFVAGSTWGTCYSMSTITGTFALGTGDNPNSQVQLVRQGHAVSHILSTRLLWDVPVEECEDIQEPSTNRDNGHALKVNCDTDFGSNSWPCPAEYPECRGHVPGSSWGYCWFPCIPGGDWAPFLQMETWLEATVWGDSITLHVGWDSSVASDFVGTISVNLNIDGASLVSKTADLTDDKASIMVTESNGSIVEVTNEFPVTVTSTTGTVTTSGRPGDVFVEVPTNLPSCGYNNDCSPDVEIVFTASNADTVERGLHLSISRNFPLWDDSVSQSLTHAEVTGISAVLLDSNGWPSGLPIQISKQWHSGAYAAYWAGYEGMWWTMNIFARIPAESTFDGTLRIFYQTYGSVPQFSHSQLSIVGYSDAWLWEEAAMYSGGESICFDPLGTHTRTFITDVRPSLMDGRWKQNVGGGDFLVYFDETGKFIYQKTMDPLIHVNGPALTNATYRSISSDEKIRSTVQISGGRTDDWVRVFFHIKYEVLADVGFSRIAFYQFGADNYLYYGNWGKMMTGQGANGEVIHEVDRTCSDKDTYEGGPLKEELTGSAPWWISLAPNADPDVLATDNGKVVGDKGLIVRKFDAKIQGVEKTNPTISLLCDKVELNPPSGISTLSAGDFVELRLELLTLPRDGEEYDFALSQSQLHGSANTLTQQQGKETWERVQASAVGHLNVVAFGSAQVESHQPIRVCATDDSDVVQFRVDGDALGFAPVVICGLTTNYPSANHGLWTREGADGTWLKLDQNSQYVTDYWQTNWVRDDQTYEFIYNIEIFAQETYFSFGPQPSDSTTLTSSPTQEPTDTNRPTQEPTETNQPSFTPTQEPTLETDEPTKEPTMEPTDNDIPTEEPDESSSPSTSPSVLPSTSPSTSPDEATTEPADECVDTDNVINDAGQPSGNTCQVSWAAAQQFFPPGASCPGPLADQCPVTCGVCTPAGEATTEPAPVDCMPQWCQIDDWDTDRMLTKTCTKTKVALGIAADADCSTATNLPSDEDDGWGYNEDDDTVCEVESPDLVASECQGDGATWEVSTCGTMYDTAMTMINEESQPHCDATIIGGTFEDYFYNKGCCASVNPPSQCDMDALYADAGSHDECADALDNDFDSEVEGGPEANCACWDALGETYRNANYDCIPEGDDWTINQLYDQQCGNDNVCMLCEQNACSGEGSCLLIESEGEFTCDEDPSHFTSKHVCDADYGHWCADCCTEDESCETYVSVYYSTMCQAIVPTTLERAYEMCPCSLPDACEVDASQCYESTMCAALIPNTYQCDSIIAEAENLPAHQLCPCTCETKPLNVVASVKGMNMDNKDDICLAIGNELEATVIHCGYSSARRRLSADDPSYAPTVDPTFNPTFEPSMAPTIDPTFNPTFEPSVNPTFNPTFEPIADCVDVNHIWDNPGYYTCGCVDWSDQCLSDGACVVEDACPYFDGQVMDMDDTSSMDDDYSCILCEAYACSGEGSCLLIESESEFTCDEDPSHFTSKDVCDADYGLWCADCDIADCDVCVSQFVMAGGCECWMDDSCDDDALVLEGCEPCGYEAAEACGMDMDSMDSMSSMDYDCVDVNHIEDNPGYYTCDCVDYNDGCLSDGGGCVVEDACPSVDGQAMVAEDLYIDILVYDTSAATATLTSDDFISSLTLPDYVTIVGLTVSDPNTDSPTQEPTVEPTKSPTVEPTDPDEEDPVVVACSRKDCNDHGTTSGDRPNCAVCVCDAGYTGDTCATQLKVKQTVKVSGYSKAEVEQQEDKFVEMYANAIGKPKEKVRIAKITEVTARILRRRLAVQVSIDYEVVVDTEEEKGAVEETLEDTSTVQSNLETQAQSVGLDSLVVEEISEVFEACTRSADCNGNGSTTDDDNRDGCTCTCDSTHTGDQCQTEIVEASTESDGDDSSSNTVIIIVAVLGALAVLGAIGYYLHIQNDGGSEEKGVELADKSTPVTIQAATDINEQELIE